MKKVQNPSSASKLFPRLGLGSSTCRDKDPPRSFPAAMHVSPEDPSEEYIRKGRFFLILLFFYYESLAIMYFEFSLPFISKAALTFGAAFVLYCSAVIVYRLTLHPLAKYPGPKLAKISDFYAVYHAYIGDLHLDMWRCHKSFGNFVRYGPNKLIANTNTAIPEIYARTANVQKSKAYQAFETSPEAHDLQSTVDKNSHARKRRVISQAFSENSLRSLEAHILRHVRAFVNYLAPDSQGVDLEKPQKYSWSSARDMSKICEPESFVAFWQDRFSYARH